MGHDSCDDRRGSPRIHRAQQYGRTLMKTRISQRCVQHSPNGWRMHRSALKVDPETCVEVVGGEDCGEGECRWNSTQGRDSSEVRRSENRRGWVSTRYSGRSDSVLSSQDGKHVSRSEVTPAMDVWPWLVGRAGWLCERYHVKANKKTAFEDCFGKPCQGEVMKFADGSTVP